MSDRAREFALAFIQSMLMDNTQSYLERGRLFESNTIDELTEAYPAAYRSFVKAYAALQPGGTALPQAADDIAAELRLRGRDIPIDSVLDDVAELEKLVKARAPQAMPALEKKLDEFLADIGQPN
jgi:hypothetical protein